MSQVKYSCWTRDCFSSVKFALKPKFSEDVLYIYLDDYAMLFCFFTYWYVCVLYSIFFEIFVSEVRYFIHEIVVIVQSIWHSMAFAFAQKLSACPSKVDKGYPSYLKGYRYLSEATMVFKCLHGLAPDYLASKFSERNTMIQAIKWGIPRTNWMLDCHVQIISKMVLAIEAPQCGVAFLVRLGARNPSGRSNGKSAKLYKARHSRKAAF